MLVIYLYNLYCFFFFFQAEDGIRDYKVTGVQTCALPIYGTEAHRPRLDAGSGGGNDPRKRGDPEFPRLAIAHDQQRRGAVRDAARVSRGHGSTLTEHGTELRERLEGCVPSRRLVPTDDEWLRLPLRNRDGEDLLRELAALNRGDGSPMALEGEPILVLP